jgi:hypothetical protein
MGVTDNVNDHRMSAATEAATIGAAVLGSQGREGWSQGGGDSPRRRA